MARNPCEYDCGRIDALEFEPRVKRRPLIRVDITQELSDRVAVSFNTALDAYGFSLLQANESAEAAKESLIAAAKEQLEILKKFDETSAKAQGIAKLLDPSEPAPLPVITVEDHSISNHENFVGTPANLSTWLDSLGSDLPTPMWKYASELSDKPPPSDVNESTAKGHLGTPNPFVLEIPLG